MPIYEYECAACGHTLDALQKVSDEPLRQCPECKRRKLRRLVSAPRFRLKGAGWYETDFKTDNQRNLAGGDDKPADSSVDAAAPADKPAAKATEPAAGKEKAAPADSAGKKSPAVKTADKKKAGSDGKAA